MKQQSFHKKKLLKVHKAAKSKSDYLNNYLSTPWHPYFIIIIAGLIVFGKTLWFNYTYFDDDILIIKKIDSLSDFSEILKSFNNLYLGPYYRPLVTISLMIDAQISYAAPWMYHISNLLYHLAAGCLTFYLLLKLNCSKIISLFASVILILHPLVTQTVAWIPGRNDSLLAVFILLSFIFFIRSLSSGKYYSYFLHILFFYFALFTKESALIFPIIILLYYVLVHRESLFSAKIIKYMIGWMPGIILWYILRNSALSGVKVNTVIFSLREVPSNLPALIEMIGKLVFPYRLSVYPTLHPVSTILGFIVITGAVIFFIFRWKMINRLMLFSLFWIILFYLPSLVVNVQDNLNRFSYLECRGYISIIGFTILLSAMNGTWLRDSSKKMIMKIAPVIILYSIIILIYSTSYRSPLDYWENAVEMSPKTSDTYYNLGLVSYQIYNNPDIAEKNFIKAIELNNANHYYHNCLGVIYGQKNIADLAEKEFNTAININPDDPDPYVNLGYLKYLQKQIPEAVSCYNKSISLDSSYSNAYYKLILLYSQEKKYQEALYYADALKSKGFNVDDTFIEEIKSKNK